MSAVSADAVIHRQLDENARKLGKKLSSDVLAFFGPIEYGVDDHVRDAVEAIKEKKDRLAVLLQTTGGLIEVTQRIAECLRAHYDTVYFIIPNYAMSAGTVLAMSGDEIYMDYYSILGPIDPQTHKPGIGFVPALGYLEQYNKLVQKSTNGTLTTAELAVLLRSFDQAELFRYGQARELSITLLKEWLTKYKFKTWEKTETREEFVTHEMRVERAVEIAETLNDTSRWHVHGRGISMSVLRNDLKLRIEDFGKDQALRALIRGYEKLLVEYMGKVGDLCVVHTGGKYMPILRG
ncbi:MAG: serine dehydrogenasease [Alphaproteobacteria bacterium]